MSKATQPITDKETLTAVMQSIATHENPKVKIFAALALNTGLRVSDIIKLEWTQINFSERIIELQETKTKKRNIIAINTRLFNLLLDYRKATPNNVYILQTEKNSNGETKHVTRSFISQELAKIGNTHNIQLSPHTFRKTFARSLVDLGTPLYVVSDILNHSSERMTRIYIGITSQDKARAFELLTF
mgnify:CR=1 FL=1